jgi:dolichol kinase
MGISTVGLLAEAPYAVITTGAVLGGLWISNIVYDLEVPHHISRKIGHAAGGLAFLASVLLFSSAFWPMLLAALFTLLLLGARLIKKSTFRGVGRPGAGRSVYSEVWFAAVALPVFGVAWLWLDRPMVALAPLLFMAWGDCLTGITRSQVYHREVKGPWGSAAMLAVCLAIAWAFVRPFWIGAAASGVAVAAEWAFGEVGVFKWGDDNWAVPLASLGCILGLLALTGNLF